jgi:hypothetical protein
MVIKRRAAFCKTRLFERIKRIQFFQFSLLGIGGTTSNVPGSLVTQNSCQETDYRIQEFLVELHKFACPISDTRRPYSEFSSARSYYNKPDQTVVRRTKSSELYPGDDELSTLAPLGRVIGVALLEKNKERKEGTAALESAIRIFPLYFDALQSLGSEYVLQQNYDVQPAEAI